MPPPCAMCSPGAVHTCRTSSLPRRGCAVVTCWSKSKASRVSTRQRDTASGNDKAVRCDLALDFHQRAEASGHAGTCLQQLTWNRGRRKFEGADSRHAKLHGNDVRLVRRRCGDATSLSEHLDEHDCGHDRLPWEMTLKKEV